ncbi:hypothetical protein RHMOL_Rhmol07G0025800 [Rhododendron molle]|uniref:Uncharacterized protein n=1 Tax=Rhododendron molle TaxID=49168 RepID=A0ACC0MW42_RHOML|nr:hypothetical protein RHMOL_Rhmol07G0025800 [Rhododendron molle]
MLYNDEDLEVMFAVADSIGLNCIEVTIVDSRGFDSGTSGCGGDVGANSSGIFDSGGDVGASTSKGISFSGQRLVGRPFESMGDVGKEDDLGAIFCPHQQRPRLSDAWKELIKSVGQLFVGGSEGFRDALRKYSIVHSFEFDFVKNETERVTAVCKVKSCKWNIHARLDKSNLRTALASTNVKYKESLIRVFSKCAYALTVAKFNQHMGNLVKHGGATVVHFLSELPNERWANVFFPGQRYGVMSSSLAKCFNSWILKERELSVVDMVDRIRKKMMKSMCLRREMSSKWEHVICPYGESRLEKLYDLVKTWKVILSSADIFEVDTDPLC